MIGFFELRHLRLDLLLELVGTRRGLRQLGFEPTQRRSLLGHLLALAGELSLALLQRNLDRVQLAATRLIALSRLLLEVREGVSQLLLTCEGSLELRPQLLDQGRIDALALEQLEGLGQLARELGVGRLFGRSPERELRPQTRPETLFGCYVSRFSS